MSGEFRPKSKFSFATGSFRRGLANAYRGWCHFFFEADATDPMKILRILLGLLLLTAYAIRALDHSFYFDANGVLDLEKMLDSFPMKYRWSFLIWFPGHLSLKICTGLFLLSLGTLTLGIFPRVSAFVAYLLHVSFMHRNMAIVYGLDMISAFLLFYLSFTRTDAKPKKGSWAAMLSSSALRLTQIQVCVIYAYSGWEKLKGLSWWKGEAIWAVVANTQIARWNMDWMAHLPLLISFATYATVLFEVYFPVLIWLRKWRPWVLALGLLLHFGIGMVVFIPFFAALMVVTYASFLTPEEARGVLQRANSLKSRRRASLSREN
jgi:hypothetical protein